MDDTYERMFDALSDVQRRRLLVALLESNPQTARPRTGVDPPSPSGSSDVRAARIRHHHTNLPKLAEYGFITWDEENDRIETGPQFEEIKPILELLEDNGESIPAGWV